MNSHPETLLPIDMLGSRIPPYAPTYDFSPPFIDSAHANLAECPVKDGVLIQMRNRRWLGRIIPGWLRREDALKLYEMAFFANDDILELGSYHGLSTAILSRASLNSPKPKRLYTVDIDPTCTRATISNLKSLSLFRNLIAISADAVSTVKRLAAEGKRFGFVFVDHSHAYQPVYEVCRELKNITVPGGFCLFHDFNDARNRDPSDSEYGVYQAVTEGLDTHEFRFFGIYGCTALYRAAETGASWHQ